MTWLHAAAIVLVVLVFFGVDYFGRLCRAIHYYKHCSHVLGHRSKWKRALACWRGARDTRKSEKPWRSRKKITKKRRGE